MATIGTKKFREHISAYLHKAEKGRTTIVTHRGKPIAKLVPAEPVPEDPGSDERWRWEMAQRGLVVHPPRGRNPRKLREEALEEMRKSGPIGTHEDVERLLDEEREDRY